MSELSQDDVIAELGPMSDAVVAEIIATGITRAELSEVKTRIKMDRGDGPGEPLPTTPVGRVVGILERVAWEPAQGPFGEAGSTMR